MEIEYKNKPIEWDNEGIMPPQELIEKGFQPGYKPPAEYFNAILNRTSACITELQEKVMDVNTAAESAGSKITVDSELSNTSTNPVQNKAVTAALNEKAASTHTHGNATASSAGFMSAADKNKLDSLSSSNNSAGQKVEGQTFYINGTPVTAGTGAEIFNKYDGDTIAIGAYSVAMGQGSIAKGAASVAMGSSSIAAGAYSVAMGQGTIANEANTAIGVFNKTPTAGGVSYKTGDVFIIGNGTMRTQSNAFRVTMAGDIMGAKEYSASGADYAEMFEWIDGNPDNEDRRGLFVTLDGEKIRPANSDDDYILGVVSATPSVVADAQTDDWGKKWKTDVFGERLLDENGAWILNENFREEENESYISRLDRKEWAAVGLVGKLIVVDDGTCEVNGYCSPANGGIATKSMSGYRVLSRIDENHIKVLIK